MASYIRNICTQNYQNLVIGFQVTVENVGNVFSRHSVYEGSKKKFPITPPQNSFDVFAQNFALTIPRCPLQMAKI